MKKNKEIIINVDPDTRKFFGQQCQDEVINKEFRELHKRLVNEVIDFCNYHNIVIDELHLNADCLSGSIPYGEWQACTDSCLVFDKFTDEYNDVIFGDKVVSNEEWNKIKLKQEPFLFSA